MRPGLPLCARSLEACQNHGIYLYQDRAGYLLLEAGLVRPHCACVFPQSPVRVTQNKIHSWSPTAVQMEPDITVTPLPRHPFDNSPSL